MHRYLRTIGFSEIRTDEDADALLDGIQIAFEKEALTAAADDGQDRFQICAAVGERLGICIEGYKRRDGILVRQEYFPFLISTDMSTTVPVSIHERVDGRGLSGLADDIRLGITLIFRLTNSVAYYKYAKTGKQTERTIAYLSAFSSDGKVILPVHKDPGDMVPVDAGLRHDMLVEAAKNGNQRAIDILNNEDMNTYAMVTDRLTREDIYSVVDSCFMPQGVECDIYQIVGDIVAVEKLENLLTDEFVYDLTVSCNDMIFHVGIAEEDIQGEPKPGRRFKGRIWMQGRVEFPD